MSTRKTPRGIRNKNPLNIRVGNNWKGEVENPTDHQFEQFTAMRWGIRAAMIILRNYIERHKIDTVRKIIERWAPQKENDTKRYISVVCNRTGFKPNEKIRFEFLYISRLVGAMAFVENGCEIAVSDIVDGWNLTVSK